MPSLSWNASWTALPESYTWIAARYAHVILSSRTSSPGMSVLYTRMAAPPGTTVATIKRVSTSSKLCWTTITFPRCRLKHGYRDVTWGLAWAIMLKGHRLAHTKEPVCGWSPMVAYWSPLALPRRDRPTLRLLPRLRQTSLGYNLEMYC